jgi:hypothetical protein
VKAPLAVYQISLDPEPLDRITLQISQHSKAEVSTMVLTEQLGEAQASLVPEQIKHQQWDSLENNFFNSSIGTMEQLAPVQVFPRPMPVIVSLIGRMLNPFPVPLALWLVMRA